MFVAGGAEALRRRLGLSFVLLFVTFDLSLVLKIPRIQRPFCYPNLSDTNPSFSSLDLSKYTQVQRNSCRIDGANMALERNRGHPNKAQSLQKEAELSLCFRFLEVSLEVSREETGWFSKESFSVAITSVMDINSEIGNLVRTNHAKLKDVLVSPGILTGYTDRFVENLEDTISDANP